MYETRKPVQIRDFSATIEFFFGEFNMGICPPPTPNNRLYCLVVCRIEYFSNSIVHLDLILI